MKEWKDYYNNDYIIFSLNNGIVNEQYFSTKHILNTYQSKIEFNIENIENFSFKNDDVDNSQDDSGLNYDQQVLDVEVNENKEQENKDKKDEIENLYKINESEIQDKLLDEENKLETDLIESPIKCNNENNVIIDDFLKDEDFENDENKENFNNSKKEIIKNDLHTEKEINQENINNEIQLNHNQENENCEVINTNLQKENIVDNEKINKLKLNLENDDKLHENSSIQDINQFQDKKKEKFKKLFDGLKTNEPEEDKNYYSRIEKIKEFDIDQNIMSEEMDLKEIPAEEKLIDIKENKYSKESENININQISNSNNSSSHDYNNLNSDNNDITDFEKFPKLYSHAQSYTIRSRDDEIRSLNDKLYSYKNQNKVILDENKKLLEIINIFKILQNLENSKKTSSNTESNNENMDSFGLNRDIDTNKTFVNNHIIFSQSKENENVINNNSYKYRDNENVFGNLDLVLFEKPKIQKNSIKTIDYDAASKFINTKNKQDKINEINYPRKIEEVENKKLFIPNKDRNENFCEDKFKQDNRALKDEKLNNAEIKINNRLINFVDNTNQNIKSRVKMIERLNTKENQDITSKKNILDSQIKLNENKIISISNYNLINKHLINLGEENLELIHNKKKTFIKIKDNLNNKGGNYSKNLKPLMSSQNNIHSNSNTDVNSVNKKSTNKISYIVTNNSNSNIDSRINSTTQKSNNVKNQGELVFSTKPIEDKTRNLQLLQNKPSNNLENDEKKKILKEIVENENKLENRINKNSLIYQNNKVINNVLESNHKIGVGQKIISNELNISKKEKDEKDLINYNNLIQYLEKYRELNDRLIETIENDKNDVKIDFDKRKKDVEYLEYVLNYISSLGENKESKDLIPFYLIDKRKLFENMVKYLYSKDDITNSTKSKNVRFYKVNNKLK